MGGFERGKWCIAQFVQLSSLVSACFIGKNYKNNDDEHKRVSSPFQLSYMRTGEKKVPILWEYRVSHISCTTDSYNKLYGQGILVHSCMNKHIYLSLKLEHTGRWRNYQWRVLHFREWWKFCKIPLEVMLCECNHSHCHTQTRVYRYYNLRWEFIKEKKWDLELAFFFLVNGVVDIVFIVYF